MTQIEIPKKKRSKIQVRARLDGPKLANRLMILYDNRANKNILTKMRFEYNILKKFRDVITGTLQVKPNIYKYRQTVKVTG